jgi:radical SAM protein with 4Fe4S-binding SPASM domain
MDNKLKEYASEWFVSYYNYSVKQLYIQFHITRLCESRCPHCYFNDLESIKGTLSFEECQHVIDEIVTAANRMQLKPLIDFTGGDPLLHPAIYDVLQYGHSLGVSVGLKCNSHQITSSTIEKLRKYSVERIYLSLEGLEIVNDSIRGKGDFNRTIKAIALLKEHGFYTRVHMTLSKHNLNETIPLMEFLIDNKFIIDVFSWSRFWTDRNPELLIEKSEFEVILEKQLAYLNKLYNSDDFYVSLDNGNIVPRIGFEFKEHIWFPFLYKKGFINSSTYESLSSACNSVNCTSTRNVYIIDNNGDIAKCRKIAESKIGNLFVDSLFEIIENDFNLKYKEMKQYSKCGKCNFFNVCAGCPAMALAKTGNQFNGDPDCFIHTMKA